MREGSALYNLSVAGFAATAPLVGEALAFRRVFECKRFATICPADVNIFTLRQILFLERQRK